ncbi:uncharacterized protein LOC108102066 isoform X2 [Drosophila ficusphila]|nr:uncharacterized protein LOC108102066 isoform X2 [Drosophila ficusphila]XP_043065048.1 uncharacterized protein LOC108102066 isoform X2 [Drosophila ficusphila]
MPKLIQKHLYFWKVSLQEGLPAGPSDCSCPFARPRSQHRFIYAIRYLSLLLYLFLLLPLVLLHISPFGSGKWEVAHAKGSRYELSVADENIFSKCPDNPPGTFDVDRMMDLTEFQTTMDENGVTISGNSTLAWEIEQEDRVQLAIKLLYFDRGTWTPTVLSMLARDFCKIMYDPNQIWYQMWTQYIKNDVKDKCVNVPGTKFIMQTYTLNMSTSIAGHLREGRYKANLLYQAFDSFGKERPTRICFEVMGDLFKVR